MKELSCSDGRRHSIKDARPSAVDVMVNKIVRNHHPDELIHYHVMVDHVIAHCYPVMDYHVMDMTVHHYSLWTRDVFIASKIVVDVYRIHMFHRS